MLTTAVMIGHDDEGLREFRDGKVESLTMLVSSLYTVAKCRNRTASGWYLPHLDGD
jgi:hypothetical protein